VVPCPWQHRGPIPLASDSEATHQDPVWRSKSDFIIGIAVDPDDTNVSSEQLYARKIDDRHFELCCIPFFVYDLALGDVVETDVHYTVSKVVTPSGRFVFRVWFGGSSYPKHEITEALSAMGALLEWSSRDLLAVDALDEAHARDIHGFLLAHQDLGHLIYESGKT